MVGSMSEDDEELSEPVIPRIDLELASAGKEKASAKQTSLTSFLSAPPSGGRWKPVHKAPPSKKKVEVVKKKIAIDPQESPKARKVASVVTEVSSDDNDKREDEQKRLEKSIERAKRKSIKQYLDSDSSKKGKLIQSMKASGTPSRAKRKKSPTPEPKVDVVDSNDETAPHNTNGENEADSASVTPIEEVARDLEVLEVHKTPASRTKKRSRLSTPRILQKIRSSMSVDDYQDTDYNRTAYSTPRRKVARHRSYSPLSFKFDNDDAGITTTPVIRRRKTDGETSVFDLDITPEDHDLIHNLSQPSTSGLAAAAAQGLLSE
ncbi:hypothetical protein COOONC_20953, partial [Cooperia oncophora]